MEQRQTLDFEGTTYLQGDPLQRKSELDRFTCELAQEIYKKKRRIEYVSTRELEKLKSCKNLDEIKAQMQAETDLLKKIFEDHPKFNGQAKVEFEVPFDLDNMNLLEMVERLTGYGFLLSKTKEHREQSIESIRLMISKNGSTPQNQYYIDAVEVIEKQSK